MRPSVPLSLLALALSLAAPRSAGADVLAGYGQYTWGPYGIGGDLGEEFSGTSQRWGLVGGVRLGRAALSVGFEGFLVDSLDEARHSRRLGGWAVGPDLAWFLGPSTGLRGYARAGYRWTWLEGGGAVTRTCEDTELCAGGFWTEVPNYAGSGARVGVGLEYVVPRAAERGFLLAFSLDAGIERLELDVIGRERTGRLGTITLGLTLGGGRLQ